MSCSTDGRESSKASASSDVSPPAMIAVSEAACLTPMAVVAVFPMALMRAWATLRISARRLFMAFSPRSYQHLLALARVNAFLNGRTWVLPVDVKEIFCDATRHRIARTVRAQAEGVDADTMLQDLLTAVPIP